LVAGVTSPPSASAPGNSSNSANTTSGGSQQPPQTIANPTPPPVDGDEVVATVRGDPITLRQLEAPLLESHGLDILLEEVQLDLAQQDAQQAGITLTDQDVEDETTKTLIAFKKATDLSSATTQPSTEPSDDTLDAGERDRLLSTLLTSQRLPRAEFDLVMRCNAYLRKLVTPQARAILTDDNVREHFNALYGEKARVKYIRLPDMLAVSKVEEDLKAGRTFDDEMKLHAYDSIGHPTMGEPLPFTRKDINYPTEFKEVAFALKPGEVSDPLQIKDSIFLVQLVELIPPQYANFDEYKDWVRQDLYDSAVQADMKQYQQNLGQIALKTMEIKDPILRRQWDQKLQNADNLREQLLKEQQAGTTRPAQSAAPAPANESSPSPAAAPPATAGAAAAPATVPAP
jgi:foldase protein PrsA